MKPAKKTWIENLRTNREVLGIELRVAAINYTDESRRGKNGPEWLAAKTRLERSAREYAMLCDHVLAAEHVAPAVAMNGDQ